MDLKFAANKENTLGILILWHSDRVMQDERLENDVKSSEMKHLIPEKLTYSGRLGSLILEENSICAALLAFVSTTSFYVRSIAKVSANPHNDGLPLKLSCTQIKPSRFFMFSSI